MGQAALEILRMIEEGTISVEEGEKLLAALGGEAEPDDPLEQELGSPPATSKAPADTESEPAPAGPPAGW